MNNNDNKESGEPEDPYKVRKFKCNKDELYQPDCSVNMMSIY